MEIIVAARNTKSPFGEDSGRSPDRSAAPREGVLSNRGNFPEAAPRQPLVGSFGRQTRGPDSASLLRQQAEETLLDELANMLGWPGNQPSCPPLSASPRAGAPMSPANALTEYANSRASGQPDLIDEYNTCPVMDIAPWVEGDQFSADSVQWSTLLDAETKPVAADLRLVKHHVANGASGAVSFFDTSDGRHLVAKVALQHDRDWVLDVEFNHFRAVHASVGPHRNLVRAHGIAQVFKEGSGRPALFLDRVNGPNGEGLRRALRACKKRGDITHTEFWGTIQFVGKRLFSVAGHLGKAGIVHCDIKPDNYLLDANTGEPVVVDLGIASKQGTAGLGSPDFCAPEQVQKIADAKDTVDERTDVYGVASTVFALAEGGDHGRMDEWDGSNRYPSKGVVLDRDMIGETNGRPLYRAGTPEYHRPGRATIDTSYTRALFDTMAARKEDRPYAFEATMAEFFDDPLTDDDTARDTLRRVAVFASTGHCPSRATHVVIGDRMSEMQTRPLEPTVAQRTTVSGIAARARMFEMRRREKTDTQL